MIDVEPLIVSGLDRLVPLPSGERADWQDVLGRAGETRRRRLGVPRPGKWSRLQIAVVVIVVGLLLVGAATATYVVIHGANPTFGGPNLTARQKVAPDVNHISYRAARLWDNVNYRLHVQLEKFSDCRGGGAGSWVCVKHHRREFITALQATIQASNSLGPESHSNRCYRRIVIYRKVLNDLLRGFVRKGSGPDQAERRAGGHVWGACVREKDRP